VTTRCKTLILGVTGSIAAAEAPSLVRRLRDISDDVHVILTRAARRFVSRRALAYYSGHPVLSDLFDQTPELRIPHVELARRADVLLVAPATASLLARCAHGLCDDLLSTTMVACRAPVIIAPNMNEAMWTSPVVQRNVTLVRELGHAVIEPTWGIEVADGLPSFGAMPPLAEILKAVQAVLETPRGEKAPRSG
jgi:phosphopantothenoylcysteine decarboxylase / phosphopantothenate---cysteine ligase